MKKAERLLEITLMLRARRRAVPAQVLAERLQVSERTIYRDIQSLQRAGIAIEGEAGVGYLIRPDSHLTPMTFTESEIEALVLGVRLLRSLSDDRMAAAADGALDRIRAVLPDRLMQRLNRRQTAFLVPAINRHVNLRHLEAARLATGNQEIVALNYRDGDARESERLIEPAGLILWGNTWVLIAWCQLRNDFRSFRLDRIETLTLTGRNFERLPEHSLKTYLQLNDSDADTRFWLDS